MKKPIKLNFCNFANFGDALSPYLIRHLTGREVVPSDVNRADLQAVGSVFFTGEQFYGERGRGMDRNAIKRHYHLLRNLIKRPLVVWGSAFLHPPHIPTEIARYRALDLRAVRGAQTRDLLIKAGYEVSRDITLGDPGLLYPELLDDWKAIEKVFDLAIVPSYSDWASGVALGTAALSLGLKVKVVNVMQADPLSTLREIAQAKAVIASAMHALIVADGMGIPNRIVDFPQYNLWKISDYYSAFGKVPDSPIRHLECLENPGLLKQLIPCECRITGDAVEKVKIRLREVLKEAL